FYFSLSLFLFVVMLYLVWLVLCCLLSYFLLFVFVCDCLFLLRPSVGVFGLHYVLLSLSLLFPQCLLVYAWVGAMWLCFLSPFVCYVLRYLILLVCAWLCLLCPVLLVPLLLLSFCLALPLRVTAFSPRPLPVCQV